MKALALAALLLFIPSAYAQSLGNAGTIEGTVVDPSGALVPKAAVTLTNAVTGYKQTVESGSDGAFRLVNIPPNTYHLDGEAPGFSVFHAGCGDSELRSRPGKGDLAGGRRRVECHCGGERRGRGGNRSQRARRRRSQHLSAPARDDSWRRASPMRSPTRPARSRPTPTAPSIPRATTRRSVTSSTASPSAISRARFSRPTAHQRHSEHGADHRIARRRIRRQDQSGGAGDHALRPGAGKVFGNIDSSYGSFGTAGGGFGLGFGNAKFGNFLAVDGLRSGRFLDTPEFVPYHDIGNNQTIFDRVDYQPTGKDAFT